MQREIQNQDLQQRSKQRGQRGSVMVVAMVTLSGLLAVAAVTLVKVKRGQQASSQARFQSMALFAAESGVSAGMDFLRANNASGSFTAFLDQTPSGIAGNDILSGDTGSLFTNDVEMSYTVTVLNNNDDPDFATNVDSDGIVVLRVVGRGPGNSMVVVEVEVQDGGASAGVACVRDYGQGGQGSDGAGRSDCLGVVNSTTVTTYTPATPGP